MIRLPRHDPIPSVNLLQQYHPHELMGKGHLRKAQCIVGAFQNFPAQADGASDHENNMALPLNPQVFYFL